MSSSLARRHVSAPKKRRTAAIEPPAAGANEYSQFDLSNADLISAVKAVSAEGPSPMDGVEVVVEALDVGDKAADNVEFA